MKAMPLSRATIIKVFFLLIITFSFSCKRKEHQKINPLKVETFNKNDKEQAETYFFITVANVSNSIISKSQIAQQKRSEGSIQELSKKIENQQNQLLQSVTEMANKRLIIITDINAVHKIDLYKLIDTNDSNFNTTFLNLISEDLAEQIKVFEKISTESNDETILKLVLQYLPQEYELLREIETIKNRV
jgi:cell division ATPase FtsA